MVNIINPFTNPHPAFPISQAQILKQAHHAKIMNVSMLMKKKEKHFLIQLISKNMREPLLPAGTLQRIKYSLATADILLML